MKSNISILFLFAICTFISCTNDETEILETADIEGPEFARVAWIGNPSIENDLSGDILDGSNHTISISSGFHLLIDIIDESIIEEGEIYFTVNNDSKIKYVFLSPDNILQYKESSIGITYSHGKIDLGAGEFYIYQPGDTYQFYSRFTDEFGNESTISWTADIVD